VIAAVATGGIPHGALIAQDMALPFAYVRTNKKGHGLTNQIEGIIESGQRVIMIEDLISTGGSSLGAVQAVKDKDAVVKGLLDGADQKFKDAECKVFTLTDYDHLIKQALENNYVREADMEMLRKWREDPENWTNN